MLRRSVFILCLSSILKSNFSDAFQTRKCDHEKIVRSLTNLQGCLNGEEDSEEFCSLFQMARDCVKTNLKDCFAEEQVETVANETMAEYREIALNPKIHQVHGIELTNPVLQNYIYLIDQCPFMPEKSFSDNVKSKKIDALEYVQTDKNCTKENITRYNVELGECYKKEFENALSKLHQSVKQKQQNLQFAVCKDLDQTIGKCLRKPLLSCFSEREKSFLENFLSNDLYDLEALEETLGADYNVSVFECPVFKSENFFSDSSKLCPHSVTFISAFVVISFFNKKY